MGKLSKARQMPQIKYLIVQIDPELAKQQKPIAKVEVAKAMFAKYRSFR